jgi:exodeoxyribonuclease-3
MRIASWNVNSAKARQDHILDFLKAGTTDVLLIQETKTQDPNFPENLYTDIGWNVVFHGQKSYNGVAYCRAPPDQRCDDRPAGR